jgi:hypothetical protein
MPPVLLRYEIREGVPACSGCPVSGPAVTPEPDGSIVLRLHRKYTARAWVRTSARPDLCVWNPISYSWASPSREFSCGPESKEMMFDRVIPTDEYLGAPGLDHNVQIVLVESVTALRQELSRQKLHRFPVTFVP